MNEEFEQLLEAEWAGELNADGLRRLESLAAASPDLATRLRQERRMSGLLKAAGPHRAPQGFAAAVFSRLETEPAPETESAEVIPVTPRGWLRPVMQWGLAAAALTIIVVEGTVLIRQSQAPLIETTMEQATSPDRTIAMADEAREVEPVRPLIVDSATPAPAPRMTKRVVASETPEASEEPTPSPSPEVMVALATPAIEASTPTPVPTPEQTSRPVPAEAGPTPQAERAPTDLGEMRLAMQIQLPPAAGSRIGSARPPASVIPSEILQPGTETYRNSFTGTPQPAGTARARSAVTRRDLETAVAVAGGRILSIDRVAGTAPVWRVRCAVNADQLQAFVKAFQAMDLEGIKTSPPRATQPPADGSATSALSRFERLEALGVTVERVGTGTASVPTPTATALRPLPEGSYTVLTGDPLMKALGSPEGREALGRQAATRPATGSAAQPIELVLWVVE